MVESEFDENSNIESVNEARQRFKIIWMDDSSKFQDMNLEDVAEHYRSIADSLGPMYKDLNMCFAVDQTSARSISLANPGVAKIHPPLGEYMPFVIAIDHQFGCDELLLVDEDEEDDDDGEEDDDDNDDDDKEVDEAAPFRVYPGSIIDEIYPCLKIGHMETHEYAYGAQGTDNVWFTAFYGIWKLDSEGRYVEPHFEDAAVLKAQHREKKRSLTTAS